MTKSKTILVILSLIMMVCGVGCTVLSHMITPAEVDRSALKYAVESGVADYNDYDAWYPNLSEAMRLKQDVDNAHNLNQEELQHLMEKDITQHGIHQKITKRNYEVAVQREEALFGETGLLSMGLGMLGMGTATGMLGLMRKRPGDITSQEMESALASVKGQTADELSVKDKQFAQLVKGIGEFMELKGDSSDRTDGVTIVSQLKAAMDKHQDTETKIAVAAVKKNGVA